MNVLMRLAFVYTQLAACNFTTEFTYLIVTLLRIYCLVGRWKNFENRSTFNALMKKLSDFIFWATLIVQYFCLLTFFVLRVI